MLAALGFILFIVIPAVYIYSFLKPAKFNIRTTDNPSGKYSRMKFTGLTALAWIVITFLGAIFTDSESTAEDLAAKSSELTTVEEKEPKQVKDSEEVAVAEPVEKVAELTKESEVKEEVVATQQEATLGLTLDEYGNKYMAEAKAVGLGKHKWGGVDLKKGAINDTFTMKLSDAVALMGVVDKNSELKSLTYIMGKTNEGDKEALNMLMLAGITARTLNPELPKEKTAGVVAELTNEAVDKFSKVGEAKESKVVGDVKYTVIANKVTGLWIVFSPKDS